MIPADIFMIPWHLLGFSCASILLHLPAVLLPPLKSMDLKFSNGRRKGSWRREESSPPT